MVTTVKTKHLPGTLELTVGIHIAIGHCAQRDTERERETDRQREREREGGRDRDRDRGTEREEKRGGAGYDCISGLALVFTPHLNTVG